MRLSERLQVLFAKFRRQPEGYVQVPAHVLFGWYARKGALPAMRGAIFKLRSHVAMPFFLGAGTSISYPGKFSTGRSCVIGRGSTLNAYSLDGITLGENVTIRENASIQCSSHPTNPGAGLTIGSRTYVGPSAIIGVGGPISVGSDCQIGSGCTFISENHEVDDDGQPSPTRVRRVGIEIGNQCWIGHRVVVLDGVSLGDHCVVGAGAVVTKSFPARSKIAGVPARQVN